LGLNVTDAFCGFKAYRGSALRSLQITEDGYAMPLQVWVQAAAQGMTIVEVPVPLIYLDESRAFGGSLDDAHFRLEHYRRGFRARARRDPAGGGMLGMTARRLRAPAADGGLLVDPPPSAVGRQVAANAARLAEWDYDFQGRRARRLRDQVRREVVGLAGAFLHR